MTMLSAPWRAWTIVTFVLLRCGAGAATPEAFSITPSTQWYGDEGTWSAISIRLGTPQQWVDVLVNTVGSETWAVGPGGCVDNNSICTAARGGIYNLSESTTYVNEGPFNLGVDQRLGGNGYAQYGFDTLTFGTTGITLNSTIIGSVNSSEYLVGMFGLGVVPGTFNNVTSVAAISQLVEKAGVIPSNSYGYTAGATYQQKGVPNSLTLGGYDANRFVAHNTTFNLDPSENPTTFVNALYVSSSGTSNNWTTPVQLLSATDRVTATIDSSTPYLWLPQSVCDSFAKTLGLTYNNSLGLYGFDGNASQHSVLQNANLEFTVSLSDTSAVTEIVNITLPYAAFDLQLSFPAIPNTTYGSPDSTKYYFPIKRASGSGEYTLGRSFLQEAYLITDYERNTYSVHQAVHTSDPLGNTSIVSISRPANSTFSPPPSTQKSSSKIPTGAIVGIAIGVVVILALLIFASVFFRRRSKKAAIADNEKPLEPAQPRGFMGRFRRRPQKPAAIEVAGSTFYPTEVGADASHERFELAAPLGPVELDESERGTLSGTTDVGSSTGDSNNMSAYQRARRKLERQRAQDTNEIYPPEKTDGDADPTMQYLSPPDSRSNFDTPLVSPVGAGSNNSTHSSAQPSPLTPGFVSAPSSPTSPPPTYRKLNRFDPANVVYAGRLPDNIHLPNISSTSTSRDGTPDPQVQTLLSEPDSIRGTSTLGSASTASTDLYNPPSPRSATAAHSSPLPLSASNLSARSPAPPSIASGSGRSYISSAHSGPGSSANISSLSASSSQRPLVREKDETKFLREDVMALRADMQARETVDPYRRRKRLDGEDLVHVPVLAERRFSWEE